MSDSNTKKVKVQYGETWDIRQAVVQRLIRQGPDHAVGVYMEKPVQVNIRKLDKHRYVVLDRIRHQDGSIEVVPGEIKEFNHSPIKDRRDVVRSHRELRARIRTNFNADFGKQVFLTLTYKENMTDGERLYRDWKAYWKRVKRTLPDHQLDYIAVAEPQGRGAWHMHVLVKSNQVIVTGEATSPNYPFWTYKMLRTKWREVIGGGGSVKITPLTMEGDKDIGTYLGSYFSNFESPDGEVAVNDGKRYKKAARIEMYPPGFKFWRCSCGIQKTVREDDVSYDQAVAEFKHVKNQEDIAVVDDATDRVMNRISRRHFQVTDPKLSENPPNAPMDKDTPD